MTDIGSTHDGEQKFELGVGDAFRRLTTDLCRSTIPKKQLKNAKAMSVDQTAFPSHFRSTQFRKQADIDKLIAQGKDLPDDVELGPDGKLIRCADLDARAGHRSAAATTGYKSVEFVGYHATYAVLTRPAHWSGDPNEIKQHPKVPAYIMGCAVDPASNNVGRMSMRVVQAAQSIAPGIKEVLADRGITQLGEDFVRPVRQLGLDITMDLKKDEVGIKIITVGTGKHKQRVYAAAGGFYPMWLPDHFKEVPEGLTTDALREWHANRSRYRWSAAQRVDGGRQFQCPQCAGRIVTNLKTHRKNARPNKTAPEIRVRNPADDDTDIDYHATHYDDTCCKGLANIPDDQLDRWQPTPWETPAWKKQYSRRLQVENVNSMVKANGELDAKFCRARGLGAHHLAVLASAMAHNLKLAMTDPLADDHADFSDNGPDDETDDESSPDGESEDESSPDGESEDESAEDPDGEADDDHPDESGRDQVSEPEPGDGSHPDDENDVNRLRAPP